MIDTGGDLGLIEQRLGLNKGDLTGNDVLIAWVKREHISKINIPSGNEGGTIDELWLLGGQTSGGITEAIIDLSSKNLPYEVLNK